MLEASLFIRTAVEVLVPDYAQARTHTAYGLAYNWAPVDEMPQNANRHGWPSAVSVIAILLALLYYPSNPRGRDPSIPGDPLAGPWQDMLASPEGPAFIDILANRRRPALNATSNAGHHHQPPPGGPGGCRRRCRR
jgi:hypothetical protein